MSIKYCARGISEQFRTPQELVTTDGVTLKPEYGGEVFVHGTDGVTLATDYDDTGGCTVDGETYADTAALNAAGLYVLSDAVTAWDVSGSAVAKSGVGVADVWKEDAIIAYHDSTHTLSTYSYQSNGSHQVFNENGVAVSYDTTKTYTLVARCFENDWSVSIEGYSLVKDTFGKLSLKKTDNSTFLFSGIKYTVS